MTCCFIPGCFEKMTEASSDLSAAISCEFTENGGGTARGQTWCLSLTKGVAGEPHTCQLRLPQIFLGIDQTTVCKYWREDNEMSNSQHRFVKNKSCQHDPISFCVKKVLFAISISYLLLREDAAFQDSLKMKLKHYGVGENIMEWVHFCSAGKLLLEDCVHFWAWSIKKVEEQFQKAQTARTTQRRAWSA